MLKNYFHIYSRSSGSGVSDFGLFLCYKFICAVPKAKSITHPIGLKCLFHDEYAFRLADT